MTEVIRPSNPLAPVRALMPPRSLTPSEARHVIERQTTRLLKLCDIAGPPVPVEEITRQLPRIEVRRFAELPTSGRTQWNGSRWVILVALNEATVRQRFSVAHELAHIVFHPLSDIAMPAYGEVTAEERLETACEYFAACLLMPRLWMKRAYYDHAMQDVASLARLFNVSQVAMRVRMEQLAFVPSTQSASRSAE
jgi:Zn-dependent peptidase ImmA (M78 family)